MSAAAVRREQEAVRHWHAEVSRAHATFERRWTQLALRRVDPDLARRLFEQRSLFDQACVTGSPDEIEMHGAAMCRGYAACVRRLDEAGEPDDAYLIGQDPESGYRIAVGHQKAAAERVSELYGQAVVWITPDEVAAVLAGLQNFKQIATIKRLFPGAEVIDIRPREPAKAESGVEA